MFLKQKTNRKIAVASACLVGFLFCFVGSLPVLAAEEWVCDANAAPTDTGTAKPSSTKFEVGLQTPFTDIPKLKCSDPSKIPCRNFKSEKGSITCEIIEKDGLETTKCKGSADKFQCGTSVPGNTDPEICKYGIHEYRFNTESGVLQEIVRGEDGNQIILTYSKYLYTFLSITIGVIAVLMLVVGGFQISIAGVSQEGLTQGKERITSALVGLLILFLSSLVLYTINPNFFSLGGAQDSVKSSAPKKSSSAETWVCEADAQNCSPKNAPSPCYSGNTASVQHKNSGACEMETAGSTALNAVCVDLKLASGCTTEDIQNKLRTYSDIYSDLDAECAAADGLYGQCTQSALQNWYEAYYCQE